jgi:hypothetical protein
MSLTDRDTLETVEKLLNERRKVAGWLTALDGRRGETSPAVYERVHADYSAKLEKVQGKLAAASDSVQALAADVAMRLTDKEQALSAKREERAEVELRAAVGEYSEREWEKRRTKLDDDITAAAAERDALHEELGRLRGVLTEAAGIATTPVTAMPAVPEPEPEIAEEPPATEEPASQGEFGSSLDTPAIQIHEQSIIAPVEPTMPLAPSFDELAFLKTVVGRPTPVASPAIRDAADAARNAPGAAGRPRSRTEEKKPAAAAAEPVPEPVTDPMPMYQAPEPPLAFPDHLPEPRVSQEMTPPRESFFGRPTPRSSEAVKSLKCAECGTLNFPTEWYCERCGGELAAL